MPTGFSYSRTSRLSRRAECFQEMLRGASPARAADAVPRRWRGHGYAADRCRSPAVQAPGLRPVGRPAAAVRPHHDHARTRPRGWVVDRRIRGSSSQPRRSLGTPVPLHHGRVQAARSRPGCRPAGDEAAHADPAERSTRRRRVAGRYRLGGDRVDLYAGQLEMRGNGTGDCCRQQQGQQQRDCCCSSARPAAWSPAGLQRTAECGSMAIQSLRQGFGPARPSQQLHACPACGHVQSTATVCRIARANAGPELIRLPPPTGGRPRRRTASVLRHHMPRPSSSACALAARSSARPARGDRPTRTPACWRLRVSRACT